MLYSNNGTGHFELCAGCEQKLCEGLLHGCRSTVRKALNLSRGDRLFANDLGCMKFWVFRRGTAAFCIGLQDGRRQIVKIETTNDVVCGMAANIGTETWIEALEPCQVCEIDLSGRAAELSTDPAFMRQVFLCAHSRLAQATNHVVTLGRLDSMERVCLFLAQMATLLGRSAGEAREVHLPMSREDIADYLGLNAETVSRLLTRIKKSRIANFSSPTDYLVPNMQALESRIPVTTAALTTSNAWSGDAA